MATTEQQERVVEQGSRIGVSATLDTGDAAGERGFRSGERASTEAKELLDRRRPDPFAGFFLFHRRAPDVNDRAYLRVAQSRFQGSSIYVRHLAMKVRSGLLSLC